LSSGPVQQKRGLLGNLRPSYIILLTALPFVLYLFLTAESYTRALRFILPGVGTTAIVTVSAYLAASVLGMILAALQRLELGKRTILTWVVGAALLAATALVLFTRPQIEYVLVGAEGGRVAILQGTPQGQTRVIQSGGFPGAGPEGFRVRSVTTVASALERLEAGEVSAAFLPAAEAPPDLPVLWETSFLAPGMKQPAVLLLVLAVAAASLSLAAYSSGHHPLRIVSELYVDLLRGIPVLVVILCVGFPLQGAIRDATGGFIDMSRVVRGIVGISLGYAAYMAEIFRAGIEAVPKGQIEAARSMGLSGWQTARFVVLPQALRIVIPPLGNEFIAMLKDTSLLSVLSVRDITQRAREFQASNFEVFPPFNTVAMLYIVLTLMASSVAKTVERRATWTR